MFYSAQILSKKGPLGIVWLAAHHDKKYLKKQQVSGTDILESCDRIIAPEAPLALRLSGQLMLGIVRIYYKQVEYLAHDANGALSKLRQSQWDKPADVDLPPESLTAAPDQITLPDNIYDDIFAGSSGLNLDTFGETPTGTPRAGTPARGRRSSITFVEENSQLGNDLFGSQRFGEPEVFETFEDAFLDKPFQVDEPERARAAPAADAAADGNLMDLGLDATPKQLPLPDDGDLPLPDAAEPDAVPTPASGPVPQSPAGPDSPEAALRLPSIEAFADGEPGTADRPDTDAAKQPSAGRRRQARTGLRPALQDANPKLPSNVISSLLADRTSLLRDRGPLPKRLRGLGPLPLNHVAVQSGAAAESLLFRPALSDALAPELYAPMRAAMGNAPTGMPPPPPRKRPAAEDATQQAEDAIEMTPQPNGVENEAPLPDGDEIPMPDAMDYHPEEDVVPPMTGPDAGPAEVLPSGSKRQRLSLHNATSGSVLGDGESDTDASNAGRVRREVDAWLADKFAGVKVQEAVLAPRQGVLKGRDRLFAARAFFEALQLQKDKKVQLTQKEPLGPIVVAPAVNWDRRHSLPLQQSQSTAGFDSESQLV